jgi:hypothetical protein
MMASGIRRIQRPDIRAQLTGSFAIGRQQFIAGGSDRNGSDSETKEEPKGILARNPKADLCPINSAASPIRCRNPAISILDGVKASAKLNGKIDPRRCREHEGHCHLAGRPHKTLRDSMRVDGGRKLIN